MNISKPYDVWGFRAMKKPGVFSTYPSGYANRLYIMTQIRESLKETFGSTVKVNIKSDVPHDMLEKITHNDKQIYLHRKGSSRALPGSHFSKPG